MTEPSSSPSRADREAQRALLEDAIMDLAGSPDPQHSAREVMRALDRYIETAGDEAAAAARRREQPVTDFRERERDNLAWVKWLVLGGAVIATVSVAIAFSGGWPVAVVIIGIWVLALAALFTT